MALLRINNGNASLLMVDTSQIIHIEADGNYCVMYLSDGTAEDLWISMKRFEELASEQVDGATELIRVGKGTIVNRTYIYRITPKKGELELAGGEMDKHLVIHASEKALTTLKLFFEGGCEL